MRNSALCINHSSLQLSVSSHTANAHWEWGDVSSSHTSRCRELSPPTAMGTLIICSCWIGKLHYSVPGNVLSTIMTAVWIVRPSVLVTTRDTWHCLQAPVHSEAIWGVMIALVFFAIFEPHDENRSWWGRLKCQKKNIFQKYFWNIFEQNQIFKKYFWYF